MILFYDSMKVSPYNGIEVMLRKCWPAWPLEDNHTLMQCVLIWQMMKLLVWKVCLKILIMVLAI